MSEQDHRRLLLQPLMERQDWISSQSLMLLKQLDRLASLAASDDCPVTHIFNVDALSAAAHGLLPLSAFKDVHDALRKSQLRTHARTIARPEDELAVVLNRRPEILAHLRLTAAEVACEVAEAKLP